jgi:hypothetical protein
MAAPPSPDLKEALCPGQNPSWWLTPERVVAGHEVWHELTLQFMYLCIVQGCVIGLCSASLS